MKQFYFILFMFCIACQMSMAVEPPAKRIVSLGPVITEEIYLLGSSDNLVGTTTWCQRPEAAKGKDKVGNVQQINLEKIVALKPDVVLATVLTDPRAIVKLRSLGLRVVEIPNAKDFEGLCQVFLTLGQITGQESAARKIVDEARAEVEKLQATIIALPKVKVFVQVGANPLVTIGQGSFANDLITLGGGENIVKNPEYLQYAREQVLASDPDVMLISSMGFDGAKEKKNWEKFKTLKSVAKNNIFIIDQYLLCSPTPVSFVETLRTVMRYFHPEAGL